MFAALLTIARAQTTFWVPVPESPGPWMSGSQEVCATSRARGRSLGDQTTPVADGVRLTCRRVDKRTDEACLIVEDASQWPTAWPESVSCTLGAMMYDVRPLVAYAPARAYGQALWVRRPEGVPIAYTWTLPEGPLSGDGRAIRADGQPWDGVTCAAAGAWLSLTVSPEAVVDEGRCQFSGGVSVPLRVENVRP